MRQFKRKKENHHQPCENYNCINYYNTLYKDANGKCKPCNIIEKAKSKINNKELNVS